MTTSLYFLKRYEKTLLKVAKPTTHPPINMEITATSKLFNAFKINSYLERNTRINDPLIPGSIIAEIAIAPEINIKRFELGVLEGASRAI